MGLYYASLNSGSNANCYYAGTKEYGILVDAGLGLRQFKRRMQALGLNPCAVKAIFISHEHTDHIRALPDLVNFLQVPVFLSKKTFESHYYFSRIPVNLISFFKCGDNIQVGDIRIDCFYKNHDGADPHSFVIELNGVRFGVFTDIGEPCTKLKGRFRDCDVAILEANYDDEMLENGTYPYFLKRRIAGKLGHLSNLQALQVFEECRSPRLKHLILGHLSQQNNTPEKVSSFFSAYQQELNVFVASRHEHSPLFYLEADNSSVKPLLYRLQTTPVQLSLFD